MGYLKIPNLYRPEGKTVLLFKDVYVLEKIHGTSAHIKYKDGNLTFFSGGESHQKFVELFDEPYIKDQIEVHFSQYKEVIVYGEAYGGKQQGMSHTYGPDLKFVAFDVKADGMWLNVPRAETISRALGLDFVAYHISSTKLEDLDYFRDQPSEQAIRNGVGNDKKAEGIVIRPLVEMTKNTGERIISKHKRHDFAETRTPRSVSSDKLEVLTKASDIADEWVTPMRAVHVADKMRAELQRDLEMRDTPKFIEAMVADVVAESPGEIVMSREAVKAMGRRAAHLLKAMIMEVGV